MPRIIPIKDLKDTAKVSEMCHQSKEPIYVTKNGYGDMVLMSMEYYEEMYRKEQLYRELEISEKDIKDILENLASSFAEKKAVKRAAKNTDEVVIDFVGKK